MLDIFWVSVESNKVSNCGLSINYVFDWAQKIWVHFTSLFPTENSARRHTRFISSEWRPDQFWYQVAPDTAKLMSKMGARDKHLLAAISPIPDWPSSVVMLYNNKAEMAACLVGHMPQESETPSWWIQEMPTRFEREEVI